MRLAKLLIAALLCAKLPCFAQIGSIGFQGHWEANVELPRDYPGGWAYGSTPTYPGANASSNIVYVCSSGTVNGHTCNYSSLNAAFTALSGTPCPVTVQFQGGQGENAAGVVLFPSLTGCDDAHQAILIPGDCNVSTGNCTTFPSRGTRVHPIADASNLWTITNTAGCTTTMGSAVNSNHWWIIGLRVYNPNCSTTGGSSSLINLIGNGGFPATNHHFVFERDIATAPDDATLGSTLLGISTNMPYFAVIDSYVQNHSLGESQAIAITGANCSGNGFPQQSLSAPLVAGTNQTQLNWPHYGVTGPGCTTNSPITPAGPHKIINNALSTTGEQIFFGGGGIGPSADMEIRGNYIYTPLHWFRWCRNWTNTPVDCFKYDSTTTPATGTSTISGGAVTGVNISTGGTYSQQGYGIIAIVFTGGGGSGAYGHAALGSCAGGFCQVVATSVDSPGTGYTSPPSVEFLGGGFEWGVQVKNQYETKSGIRFAIIGNVLMNSWFAGQFGQGITLDMSNGDGQAARIRNGTIAFNYIGNVCNTIDTWPNSLWNRWDEMENQRPLWGPVNFHDNLIDDSGSPTKSCANFLNGSPGTNTIWYYWPATEAWHIYHNTENGDTTTVSNKAFDGDSCCTISGIGQISGSGFSTDCLISDNIFLSGQYGFNASTTSGQPSQILECPLGKWKSTNNVIVADAPWSWINDAQQNKPANYAAVGFTNYVANAPGGNYKLTAGSAFAAGNAHQASDCTTDYYGGTAYSRTTLGYSCDNGADITTLNSKIAGVVQLEELEFPNPRSGTHLGSTTLYVWGNGFDTNNGAITVTVGGVSCTGVTVIDYSHLSCTTGAHAVGAVDIAVTQGSHTVTLTGGYTYN